MIVLEEYNFSNVYDLILIIDDSVKSGEGFWNFNKDYFIESVISFEKDSLLHLYIVTTAINYYRHDLRKNPENFDFFIEQIQPLCKYYSINIQVGNITTDEAILKWYDKNIKKIEELFDKMADEVFYILFANRSFLLEFNKLVSETLEEIIPLIPKKYLTQKGTLKRKHIPQWVKNAVFHRDKGRCVFCNTDLTGLINNLNKSNYDHIIPLDKFGVNDPCNIQLTCQSCNLKKTNNDGVTTNYYIPWWNR